MPILPPALDDRNFNDLVEELLARIPAHSPEWTDPRPGDPGRTLIELFAWLTDTLLYRANLIPERQRLAFLRLLGVRMRPAMSAQGLVSLAIDAPSPTQAISLQPLATVKGAVSFETRSEITVFPVTVEAYYKRPLTEQQTHDMAEVIDGLKQIYQLKNAAAPYITTPIFAGGLPEPDGFNVIKRSVDQSLWLALLADKPELAVKDAVKQALGVSQSGGQPLINIGVVPALAVPALFEEIGPRARIPHVWEICTGREIRGEPEYLPLTVVSDSSVGLTRRGIIRLALPAPADMGALENNVRRQVAAGTGDRPPRLDVPEIADRLVTWIRLRPTRPDLETLSLSWVGINTVEVDQRQTITGRIVGVSNGTADQEFLLPGQSIEPDTLQLQVEEAGRGYQLWQQVDDLALMNRDAAVYRLDSEAGTVRFGDGVRGRIPEATRRIRVAMMRSGGGRVANLPAGSLTDIAAKDLTGNVITTKFKVLHPLPMEGGEDPETLAAAERRIPDLFRHRDRAVTANDYQQLAAETPGVRLGRVEVLPRFKPQQRRSDVPGVVSVMVLPSDDSFKAPNPRPDRPLLEAVHAYLDARRPLATEFYVIGCQYIPLGVSVGVQVQAGFGQETVLMNVREALYRFLWSLAPGGIDGTGWQLGKAVHDRELEVVVARVAGVSRVEGVNLFRQQAESWQKIQRPGSCQPVELKLEPWQLPELLSVVAVAAVSAPDELMFPSSAGGQSGVAVPIVPEMC